MVRGLISSNSCKRSDILLCFHVFSYWTRHLLYILHSTSGVDSRPLNIPYNNSCRLFRLRFTVGANIVLGSNSYYGLDFSNSCLRCRSTSLILGSYKAKVSHTNSILCFSLLISIYYLWNNSCSSNFFTRKRKV